jgi:hypothetical protein
VGSRGPVPKRSDQRRRRNEPEVPIDQAPGAPEVMVPDVDETWHPIAQNWYTSLAASGQSSFYEPSDWATAYLIAESMSRDLSPQAVGIIENGPRAGEVIYDVTPVKGANLNAYLKAFGNLLVTEGDRRRASVELQRPAPEDPDAKRASATVTDIRSRLGA